MGEEFSRTELLLGAQAVGRLACASVAVFGVGGVGSYAVEALARAGIGRLLLCDGDVVSVSNINRQLVATWQTIGSPKVEVMKERVLSIHPQAKVEIRQTFYSEETAGQFDFSKFDYIVDAIDTVSSKLLLVEQANAAGCRIISCMGAGNKLDPTRFEVADIYQTSVCPLARVMRRELRARGISSLKVVYSKEEAARPAANGEQPAETRGREEARRPVPGSVSFVPSAAGLILAGEVIRDLCGISR